MNYTHDPELCQHNPNSIAGRGNKQQGWWTCLACGTRWERIPLDDYHKDQSIQGTDKVNFGQHCGRTYQEVYQDHPKYSNWVLETLEEGDACCEGMKRLGRYLMDMDIHHPREPQNSTWQAIPMDPTDADPQL